jgi:hypothetical protein
MKPRRFQLKKKFVPAPKYFHYTEANVTKAGASAFLIRVSFYNNPFTTQPEKTWWIRGFKRAEREQEDRDRRSKRVQESLPFESEE